jgi:lysophospholipase L1-like esterase
MGNAAHRGRLWLLTLLLLLTPALALLPVPTALAVSAGTTMSPSEPGPHGNMAAEITILGEIGGLDASDGQTPDSQPEASPTPTTLAYYALGDSVASGYGLMDDDPDPCHRSTEASYPALIQQSLEGEIPTVHFSLLACSGASFNQTTAQISQCQNDAPARYAENCNLLQVNEQFTALRTALSQQAPGTPTLVTLTVGIDDLDWTDPRVMMDLMSTSDDDFVASMDQLSQQTADGVRAQIDALLSDYPNVKVVVTGYYNPFNQDSWILRYANLLKTVSPVISPIASLFQSLNARVLHGKGSVKPFASALGWVISQVGRRPNTVIPSDELCTSAIRKHRTIDCYDRTQRAIDSFNASLDRVVSDETNVFPGRIAFAPVADKFRGHESPQPLCGAAAPSVSDSWIQYPNEDNINSPVPDVEQPLLYPATHGDCFHPNYDGAKAYARAVEQAAQMLGY